MHTQRKSRLYLLVLILNKQNEKMNLDRPKDQYFLLYFFVASHKEIKGTVFTISLLIACNISPYTFQLSSPSGHFRGKSRVIHNLTEIVFLRMWLCLFILGDTNIIKLLRIVICMEIRITNNCWLHVKTTYGNQFLIYSTYFSK